jgi:hypothetical protein
MTQSYRTRRRQPPADCCPTCGRKAELPEQIFLDMDRMVVTRCGLHAFLRRAEIVMLKELLDAWPRQVGYERLAYVGWGDDPPRWASGEVEMRPYNLIQVKISQMRPKIAPLGLSIPRSPRFVSAYTVEIDPLPKPKLVVSS